jgi:hypothetical protein
MYTLTRTLILAILIALITAQSAIAHEHVDMTSPRADQPLVQIALLLDTSNSMDGLIDQAKSQLWRIVNEVSRAQRDGRHPRLEVALYEYGNNRLQSHRQWIRNVLAFSTDLDAVSEALFSLSTSGGEEYCGAVIDRSLTELQWSPRRDALKMIYIAGNEPFTQGPTPYKKALHAAIKEDVIVNTIFCGNFEDGRRGAWMKAARIADGSYAVINQDRKIAHISAPQDDEIARLSVQLNGTYLGFGHGGAKRKARQHSQDKAAASVAQGAPVARAVAKASAIYKQSEWDLVDAMEEGSVGLANLAPASLPEPMRAMNTKERKEFVAKSAKKRKKLQAKILKLNEAREKHVAKKKGVNSKADKTLDEALIEALQKAGKSRGFSFE